MVLFVTYARSSKVHKTARPIHLKSVPLPLVAPCCGISDTNWGEERIAVRHVLKVHDLSRFPLMPAPDSSGDPTGRPLGSDEASAWMRLILENKAPGFGIHYTSHSLKATCLSYCAKHGVDFLDRKMGQTYSRDTASRPLLVLSTVLKDIREGRFLPDSTRLWKDDVACCSRS